MADTITYTYDNEAIKEDLLNLIANVDPVENKLLYGLKSSTAKQPIHNWLNDTLGAVGANAAAEGASLEGGTRTNPSRDVNYTQIFTKVIAIPETEIASDAAGMSNRYAYEMNKALKEFGNDVEYALMRGTLVCGAGTTARSMKGVKTFASTLKTSQSGVSLSESIFLSYLDDAWAQGITLKETYMGAVLKRRVNEWTANSTKNIDSTDRRLVNSVDVYEGTNGIQKIMRHRYITVSGDNNYDMLMCDPQYLALAWLEGRKPKSSPLAKISDAKRSAIIGEATLEVRHEKAVHLAQAHL